MADMTREAVKDIDEIAQRFMDAGLLKVRLGSSFIPVMGVNHKRRREFGME